MPLTPAALYSTSTDTAILYLRYGRVTCVGAGEAFDDVDEEDDESEDGKDAKDGGEEVDVVDEDFVCVGEVHAEIDNRENHQGVEEVHDAYEGLVDDAADCFRVADCEDVDEVANFNGLHG
jgi:hypothetical protein